MTHTNILELCTIGGVILLATNLWIILRVLRPIRKLSLLAVQLSQGELDSFEQQCGGIPEIRELQRAMSGMVGHVRRAQQQNRAYAEQLAEGQENERKRIARELHDETIQSVIAVTQALDMAKAWIKNDPPRAIQMLKLAREQAVEIVTNLRNLIGGLRPPALEELGLIPALEMQLNTVSDYKVSLNIMGEPRRLDEVQEITLFRATQEALRNISKHSHAKHIQVDVDYQSQGIMLTLQDDGQGFCLPSKLGDLAFENHYGLLGIQERVTSLGGRIKIDSKVGQGTTLQVYVPSNKEQPSDLARDPVCSALIEPRRAYGSVAHQDKTYYFCCPVCQGAFQKEPDLYLNLKYKTNSQPI